MPSLLAFCLDQSSSMDSQKTVDAFNVFLTKQQYRMDDCTFYLAKFDDYYKPAVEFQSIFDVPLMSVGFDLSPGETPEPGTTTLRYAAQGSTALYDAIALTAERMHDYIGKLPAQDKPVNVTLVVQTDGGNNVGYRSLSDIQAVVATIFKLGWNILFLAEGEVNRIFDTTFTIKEYVRPGTSPYVPTGWAFTNICGNEAMRLGVPKSCIIEYEDASEGFSEAADELMDSVVTGTIGKEF